VKQPKFRPLERGLLVELSSVVKNWQDAILLVKPDTVLRWHREGFRLLWKRKSRSTKPRQTRISTETIALVRDMAIRNKTWGAERICGELFKLGIRVAKRTVQRHILAVRPPGDGQSRKTVLRNHVVWAMDVVQVYDVWFRPMFAFFVIDVNTKEVVHVAVTRAPNARWTARQIRQATLFGEGPQFILRDRDDKFTAPAALPRSARAVALRATRPLRGLRALRVGADFDRVAKGAGIRVLKTAVPAPLMNATGERFIGSVRRGCLDHVIVLGEAHLQHVLEEYCFQYFNRSRAHQGLEQRVPVPSGDLSPADGARLVALPMLGGLHHEYRWAA